MTRYVLIGSGIAALSAAEAIRQTDATGSITLVSEEPHPFYSRPGLAYLLRKDIGEEQLRIRTEKDIAELRLERLTARVERLEPAARELVLADGRRLNYDRLLLATGALAAPPPFPGANLAGVVKLDSLNDTRRILQLARRRRPAVVVGGGITALELAEGLCTRGMKVQYFLRGTRYLSDVLDEVESRMVLDRLRREGVTIRTGTQVKEVVGVEGRVNAVVTQAEERVSCEVVAVAIGVRPRVELAKAAGLTVRKGIVVDEFLETSALDVFAAGDVAEVVDPRTGNAALDVLWPVALQQGLAVGANMAGQRKSYLKGTPFNVTQLAGLKTTIIGAVGGGSNEDLVAITRGESEAWRRSAQARMVGTSDDVNRVRLVLDGNRLIGALVMGEQGWSRPLQQLIVEQADVAPIRDALLQGGAIALEQLAAFHLRWEQAQKKAPSL